MLQDKKNVSKCSIIDLTSMLPQKKLRAERHSNITPKKISCSRVHPWFNAGDCSAGRELGSIIFSSLHILAIFNGLQG